jgi:hypothetical protein
MPTAGACTSLAQMATGALAAKSGTITDGLLRALARWTVVRSLLSHIGQHSTSRFHADNGPSSWRGLWPPLFIYIDHTHHPS